MVDALMHAVWLPLFYNRPLDYIFIYIIIVVFHCFLLVFLILLYLYV